MSEVKGVTSDSRASELFIGSESEPQCSLSSLAFFSELPFCRISTFPGLVLSLQGSALSLSSTFFVVVCFIEVR